MAGATLDPARSRRVDMNPLPPLFEDRDRHDPKPRRCAETSLEFLDRVLGECWNRLRGELNRWFAAYPDHAACDLPNRFRGDDGQHDVAYWELYLHQVLTGTGRRVTPQMSMAWRGVP